MVFRIGANGTGFKLLHSFTGGATDGSYPFFGKLVARGSALYGMSQFSGADDAGVIFRINKNGKGFAVLYTFSGDGTNGSSPLGSLIFGGAKLYGLTLQGGGIFAKGTIFKIDPDGTDFELLHSFPCASGEGCHPYGDPVYMASKKTGAALYGLTFDGGSADFGVIFSYKLK